MSRRNRSLQSKRRWLLKFIRFNCQSLREAGELARKNWSLSVPMKTIMKCWAETDINSIRFAADLYEFIMKMKMRNETDSESEIPYIEQFFQLL